MDYSPNEMVLFRHYGVDNICQSLMPHNLYCMMAEKAFLANEQSAYANALRRALDAMNTGHTYRMTPEFEQLIEVLPEPEP